MPDRKFQRVLTVATVLPALLLGAVTVTLAVLTTLLLRDQARVNAAEVVLSEVSSLLTLHVDLETGVRGWLLTSDERTLDPFRQAVPERERAFARLETRVDPEDLPALHEAREASDAWMTFARACLADPDRHRTLEATLEGKAVMDRLRREVANVSGRITARRESGTRQLGRSAGRVLLGACALTLLLGTALSILTRRQLRWGTRVLRDALGEAHAAAARLAEALAREERTTAQLTAVERALRDSYATLDTVFQTAPVGLGVWDAELRYVRLNQELADMNGQSVQAHLHRTVAEVLPDLPQLPRLFQDVLAGRTFRNMEITGRTPADPVHQRWWNASYYPIRAAEAVVGVAAVVVEVTEQKRAFDRVEERVRQRTAELAAAIADLESFSYSVSHDLRAPLRSIDGFSRAVLEDAGGLLPPESQQDLERVRAAAQRMGQLIDDLLSLARVGRKELQRERVDLGALARSTFEALARRGEAAGVELRVQAGLVADTDRGLVSIVIENLLSNAVKFSAHAPHGTVEVGRVDGPRSPFFVRDHGVGFDMSQAEKLFRPFSRLHRQDEFPGTGIGLATVRRALGRLGGRAWAESRPGDGATFFFTLPEAS